MDKKAFNVKNQNQRREKTLSLFLYLPHRFVSQDDQRTLFACGRIFLEVYK